MRTRTRLIEVIETVNARLYPQAAYILKTATSHAKEHPGCPVCVLAMQELISNTTSPHICELATEALHYLENP